MLKRVGAVVLTVVMLLSMVCTFAVASAAEEVAGALEVTADKTVVQRGEEVKITVKLNNTEALTGLIIWVDADSRLTLKGTPVFFANPMVEDEGYAWASANALAFPGDKVIATFTYTANSNAIIGPAKVTVTGEASDNGEDLNVRDKAITAGAVQVSVGCNHDYSGAALVAPEKVTDPATAQHGQKCNHCEEVGNYQKCTFTLKSTTDHTNDAAGAKTYACACGATYDEIIPAGHKIVMIYEAATATTDGKWIEHCTVCNKDIKTTPITASHPGKDVTNTKKYYYKYTQYAKASGLMVGDDKGNFNPDKNIKRGEFASVLARIYYGDASKIPSFKNSQLTLTDIKGKWYRHAAQAMYNEGIISGYEQKNGTFKFKGDDPITREAVVSLFHRLYKKMHQDTTIKFADPGSVIDMNKVSKWAKADVQWSLDTGLVVGDATTKKFNPKSNIKRRDMAVILTKYDIAITDVYTDDI
ncbi:MAG: S-layer homology domain-containing protein [Clostridia bacterium]|nr:S-layer homology domain-containing protein [Clostridia bacterium]